MLFDAGGLSWRAGGLRAPALAASHHRPLMGWVGGGGGCRSRSWRERTAHGAAHTDRRYPSDCARDSGRAGHAGEQVRTTTLRRNAPQARAFAASFPPVTTYSPPSPPSATLFMPTSNPRTSCLPCPTSKPSKPLPERAKEEARARAWAAWAWAWAVVEAPAS